MAMTVRSKIPEGGLSCISGLSAAKKANQAAGGLCVQRGSLSCQLGLGTLSQDRIVQTSFAPRIFCSPMRKLIANIAP